MQVDSCSMGVPYPGGLCEPVLEDMLLSMDCDSELPLSVLHGNQEGNARVLLPIFSQSHSLECRIAAIPFLCVHLFGLCDSSDVPVQLTSLQCKNIRDNLCTVEWGSALGLGFVLPDCERLPEEPSACSNESSETMSTIIMMLVANDVNPHCIIVDDETMLSMNASFPDFLPCQEHFFRPENWTICVPSCFTWSEFTPSEDTAFDVVILLSATTGIITGTAVIVISFLRFKNM